MKLGFFLFLLSFKISINNSELFKSNSSIYLLARFVFYSAIYKAKKREYIYNG